MSENFAFKVCRGCLAPEISTTFTSLFCESTNFLNKFFSITHVDILCDSDENEALICDKCIEKLDSAFAFAEHVRKLEEVFFANARIQKLKLKEKTSFKDDTVKEQVKEGGRKTLKRKVAENSESKKTKKVRTSDVESTDPHPETSEDFHLKQCVVALATVLDNPPKEEIPDPDENQQDLETTIEPENLQFNPLEEDLQSLISSNMMGNRKEKTGRDRASMIQLPAEQPEHSSDESRRHSVGSKIVKGIPCEFEGCGKVCRDKFAYNQHQASHSDARPYVCHCGLSYKLKQHLNVHQKNAHSQTLKLET